ncbi:hypothetical protein RHGRI_019711 [Rhododendron griersonianum]|uniref:Uncharacterized protein n=1 Tax=Rhododendron griersonianum TaxID=479676 RepID=A0AAV6JL07_9ERIC|nr:hypothetical protein RHGRI_019711 [Rhododendron griersonianum]
MEEENAVELLQRFRRDRRILLDYILSGSFIKKVVMPPGAVSLDDVDLDQVSVDYVLSCAKKGSVIHNLLCLVLSLSCYNFRGKNSVEFFLMQVGCLNCQKLLEIIMTTLCSRTW